jgi:3-oxoadipate enol-lactonase
MPTAPIRDLKMAYDSRGPAAGPPVLLVHGLGNSSLVWADTTRRLAEAGYRAVVGDCRGHGATSKPRGPYAVELMADDWAFLHAWLGLPPAHWVGASMGGAVALAAALRHPARVRSLVLVDSWARTDAEFARVLRERLATLDAQGLEAYARLAYPQAYGEPFRRAHPEAFEAFRARVLRSDVPALREAILALERLDLSADLGRVRAPTTVIVGEVDALLPPRHSEAIADAVPGARLVRLPGVGHLPMVESFGDFLGALLDHLKRA